MCWRYKKRKKLYGVAILLAPRVRLERYTEHLPARIISSTLQCKGLKLSILNVYSQENKDSGAWDCVLGHNNADRSERINLGKWENSGTGRWKRVDYICTCSEWVTKSTKSYCVFIGPSVLFDKDHKLLVIDIRFP